MDRLLYVSSVGLANLEQAQTAHANNLANVSTRGFRADLARVVAKEVSGDGYQTRVYGINEGAGVDLSEGTRLETGRSLDVAIDGSGLFEVLDSQGLPAYTRDGALRTDQFGQLLSSRGQPVMGQGGPIVLPPHESILVGSDGSITIRPQGQGSEALVQIDRLKLVNPPAEQVRKDASGMLRNVAAEAEAFAADESVRVSSGFLESSNVNAVHELTEILALARQFELEVRMMNVAETNDEAASQLLRIG